MKHLLNEIANLDKNIKSVVGEVGRVLNEMVKESKTSD